MKHPIKALALVLMPALSLAACKRNLFQDTLSSQLDTPAANAVQNSVRIDPSLAEAVNTTLRQSTLPSLNRMRFETDWTVSSTGTGPVDALYAENLRVVQQAGVNQLRGTLVAILNATEVADGHCTVVVGTDVVLVADVLVDGDLARLRPGETLSIAGRIESYGMAITRAEFGLISLRTGSVINELAQEATARTAATGDTMQRFSAHFPAADLMQQLNEADGRYVRSLLEREAAIANERSYRGSKTAVEEMRAVFERDLTTELRLNNVSAQGKAVLQSLLRRVAR